MAYVNRLRIIVNGQNLDYTSAEDLGLSFQRIADDEVDMSKRYGEFSYSFDVPKTKNNNVIFNNINSVGSKNIFKKNRDLPCVVFNNDELLLSGVISLESVNDGTYSCVLYSNLKEFSDFIADKTLQQLQFPVITWDYETSIVAHINNDYQTSDDTYWQFPLTYYTTYFTPYNTFKNKVDYKSVTFDIKAYAHQQYFYLMNNVTSNTPNRFYHHQFPPAFYVVSLLDQIFKDAGWTYSGQFFNQESTKRLVMLYSGDNDLYDRAISASASDYDDVGGIISTSGLTTPLYPAKLCVDMLQSEFLNGIMNMFCLYPIVDTQNKSIKFSTFSELFGDTFNPYNITDKVFKDTVKFSYNTNNDPSIYFTDSENFRVNGDNATSSGTTNNASTMVWKTVNNNNLDSFFNHRGGTSDIELPFAAPTVKKTLVWNNNNISGTVTNSDTHTIFQPLMSSNTPYKAQEFAGNTGDTYVFNDEGTISFDGAPTIHFYHGKSNTDIINRSGKGAASLYYYTNIYTNGVQNRVPICFCSPFMVSTYRDAIDAHSAAVDSMDSVKTIASTYLRSIWNNLGTINTEDYTGFQAPYSLVFDSSSYLHDTLWTKFHQPKYERYQKSEVLEADMRMTTFDWNQMQLNRPILYNNEIYHIIEISGFNPITQTASLRLLKTL